MYLVGMDGMKYLKSTDPDERDVMTAMLNRAVKFLHDIQKQQAILIANQVSRLFKR